jgi:hypothetical protein
MPPTSWTAAEPENVGTRRNEVEPGKRVCRTAREGLLGVSI